MKGIYYTLLMVMMVFGLGMATLIGVQGRWTGYAYIVLYAISVLSVPVFALLGRGRL